MKPKLILITILFYSVVFYPQQKVLAEKVKTEVTSVFDSGPVSIKEKFYPNGALKERSEFRGIYFFRSQKFKENGNPLEGIQKEYYEDQKTLKMQAQYKNGFLHGISKKYYRNGVLESEENFENGKREGPERHYYFNGKIQNEGVRKGGLISEQVNYNLEGQKHGYYEKHWPTPLKNWPNGQFKEEGNYQNGQLESQKLYNENGQLIKRIAYRNGEVTQTLDYSKGSISKVDECLFDFERSIESKHNYIPGEILVIFDENVKQEEALGILKSYGLAEPSPQFTTLSGFHPCLLVTIKVPVGSEKEWLCKLNVEKNKNKTIINQLHNTDNSMIIPM